MIPLIHPPPDPFHEEDAGGLPPWRTIEHGGGQRLSEDLYPQEGSLFPARAWLARRNDGPRESPKLSSQDNPETRSLLHSLDLGEEFTAGGANVASSEGGGTPAVSMFSVRAYLPFSRGRFAPRFVFSVLFVRRVQQF